MDTGPGKPSRSSDELENRIQLNHPDRDESESRFLRCVTLICSHAISFHHLMDCRYAAGWILVRCHGLPVFRTPGIP